MESNSSLNVDVFKFLPNAGDNGTRDDQRRKMDGNCGDYALFKMLEQGLHADITLVAQGGSVKAHRSVLASVSPVFYAMFHHNMKEQLTSTVDIPDMTIDGLQLFLLVLYTTNEFLMDNDIEYQTVPELAEVAIDEHFAELWGAAYKYQVVTRLEDMLMSGLQRNLTPDNCWDYYKHSSLQTSVVSNACRKYIVDHYDAVIESKSILKEMRCNPEQVQSIMKTAAKRRLQST